MNLLGRRQKQLLHFLTADAERGILNYTLQGIRKGLDNETPEKPTALSTEQQMVAMGKLLECAEVNFRTLCDPIHYQSLKCIGVVNSVDEFLRLVHPNDVLDASKEDAD